MENFLKVTLQKQNELEYFCFLARHQTTFTPTCNFHSPGFTAAYCTYVLLDLHSSKVVALWVAQKNMVSLEQLLQDKFSNCVN